MKRVFNFLCNSVSNISHPRKNSAKFCRKCTYVFTQSDRYFCRILISIEFSEEIFEKFSNIEFHEETSDGNRVLP